MDATQFYAQNKEAKYETVPITQLKPAPYNPRKRLKQTDDTYKTLETSMRKFGLVDPIIVNTDYTIIAGHQRYYVLKNNKIPEVEVRVVNLNKIDEKIVNLALNKISGEFDMEAARHRLEELEDIQQDIALTGFTQAEFEAMELAASNGLEGIYEDEKKEEEEKEKPKVKIEYLMIAGYRVPITAEERDTLVSKLEQYIDIFDSPIGFVSYLLSNPESSE